MAVSRDESMAELERVLQSPRFRESGRLGPFLRHLVTLTLAAETGRLKESVLGLEFFRRGPNYDPRLDPVVRVEARRLRQRLEEFYADSGSSHSIRLTLPKGGYVVSFERTAVPARPPLPKWVWIGGSLLLLAIAATILIWPRPKPPAEADPARVALLRGQYQMNLYSRDGMMRAIEYFNESLRHRPNYAPALAALSQTYAVLAYYGELPKGVPFDISRSLAERAVAADSTLADAHAALGFALAFHQWRWSDAEASFKKALSIDPKAALGHSLYGVSVLLPQARFDAAINELRQALNLDPNASFTNFTLAFALLAAGRTEEAIQQYRRTLELDNVHPDMEWDYGMALGLAGRHREAAEAYRRSRKLRGAQDLTPRGLEAFFSGDIERARRDAPEQEKGAAEGTEERMDVVRLFSMLGDKDRAFLWLERAIEAREPQVIWLKVDPRLSSLRSDPRFQPMAARIGL